MSFLKDNAVLAVRKAAAAWAVCKAEKPIWVRSVFNLNEAIDNALQDLEDRSMLDPMFFLLSKMTGQSSRAIVAVEIVVNQVQAHPNWFTGISDDEKFGDLNPDRLLKDYLEYRKAMLKAKTKFRTDTPKDREDLEATSDALDLIESKDGWDSTSSRGKTANERRPDVGPNTNQ